ncbi:hypothetical protein [Bradyrhizobium sp. WD16]|uniref:hypothetical protein n=1 Tax=Bradyrhizobium sp. WD16 TaxID=1521768 RepID=UPI0020A3FEF8|nr:hypothetical protein [Bradyrhizobium sp. WD16]
MNVLDIMEVWWRSLHTAFEAVGVLTQFGRSPPGRLNPSCGLNLRLNSREADLLVWESGEAELAVGEINGTVRQTHFDDLRGLVDLATVLAQLAEFVLIAPLGGPDE